MRFRLFYKRHSTLRTLILSGLTLFIFFGIITFWSRLKVMGRDAIYLVRPLWDKPGKRPEIVIPHFHADSLSTSSLCQLHNWTIRNPSQIPTVIDLVMFSSEIDILEIRLKELWDVVDKFIVVESDRTFTGKPKPFFLANELKSQRFKWAEKKLLSFEFDGLSEKLPEGETPFYNEIKMRQHMSYIINYSYSKIGLRSGDLVIQSDVDEIPSAKTIRLLKACQGYPDGLHLEMRNYLYSFEFYLDRTNWKPHITIFQPHDFQYSHQWSSNYVLADAGWHCSFCFRYLSQFVFKMLAYSHTDRVTSPDLLDKRKIQDKICRGADIFDMFPEGYTYKELISKMGDIPKTESAIDIPDYVVQNSERFKYLLPGGCIRADLKKSEALSLVLTKMTPSDYRSAFFYT